MGRSALQKFAHGAATAGAKFLGESLLMDKRAQIQADRDRTLEGYRVAGQESQQTFTAEQNRLNREEGPQALKYKAEIAKTEEIQTLIKRLQTAETDDEKNAVYDAISLAKGQVGAKYVVVGGSVFNKATEKMISAPKDKDHRKWMAPIARDIFEAQKVGYQMPKGHLSYKEVFDKLEIDLGFGKEPAVGGTPPPGTGGESKIVIPAGETTFKGSGVDGAVTEADIQMTMLGPPTMTREQVMARLRGQ